MLEYPEYERANLELPTIPKKDLPLTLFSSSAQVLVEILYENCQYCTKHMQKSYLPLWHSTNLTGTQCARINGAASQLPAQKFW